MLFLVLNHPFLCCLKNTFLFRPVYFLPSALTNLSPHTGCAFLSMFFAAPCPVSWVLTFVLLWSSDLASCVSFLTVTLSSALGNLCYIDWFSLNWVVDLSKDFLFFSNLSPLSLGLSATSFIFMKSKGEKMSFYFSSCFCIWKVCHSEQLQRPKQSIIWEQQRQLITIMFLLLPLCTLSTFLMTKLEPEHIKIMKVGGKIQLQ